VDPISALAALVDRKLAAAQFASPGLSVIQNVLQVVNTTSMKREEAEPLRCCVVYLDPTTKHDAEFPGADSWSAVPLSAPVPFDVRHLAKLSRCADPGAIVLAVFPDESGRLVVWGFVDQVAVHSQRLAAWETWQAEATPGVFHVTVNGVADLTVYRGLGILGALKQDVVLEKYDDVLRDGSTGPISMYLDELAKRHSAKVRSNFDDLPDKYALGTLGIHVRAALARLLLQIQRYKHGGALLITEGLNPSLDVHVGLTYDRLPQALVRFATQALREADCNHHVYDHLLVAKKSIPPDLFGKYVRTDFGMRHCMSEMAGCVKFVSSLSRVDGLVLMDRDLVVRGYGVEIVDVPEVETVYRAEDEGAKMVSQIDAGEFGTRHRSMFRYCNAHYDSLGFVISQDGLVRAVRKVKDKLVVWENVKVLLTINEEECTDRSCPHCRIHDVEAHSGHT